MCLILIRYTEYCKNCQGDLGFCVRVLSFVVVFKDLTAARQTIGEPQVKFKFVNYCSFLSANDP